MRLLPPLPLAPRGLPFGLPDRALSDTCRCRLYIGDGELVISKLVERKCWYCTGACAGFIELQKAPFRPEGEGKDAGECTEENGTLVLAGCVSPGFPKALIASRALRFFGIWLGPSPLGGSG